MAKERRQLDRRWVWLGASIFLVIVFFTARFMLRERLPVRAVPVGRQELSKTIATNGRVEPVTNYQCVSPISTTVKAVYVQPGDKAPAGKLLMVLDDVQARARLAGAESGVKSAQAALEAATHNGSQAEQQMAAADVARSQLDRDQAQHDLDALTKLNATGAASASEVAAARGRLAAADGALHAATQSATSRYSPAEVARAQAALSEAEAGLEAARQVEAQTQCRAPVAGTAYSVNAKPTEFVEAGKVLLELADLEQVRVRAYFDEPEIGQLAVGQKILIKWDAKPNEVWNGHIARLPANVITYTTRNVGEVLVAIDDRDGELLPDTNVTVTVTTHSENSALSVPREALHAENRKNYVYKVIDDDRLEVVPVTIGTITLTQVAILSGLKEGDVVATGTTNGQPLQTGVPITVVQP
jgi:HlyD family secretion protein